MFEAYKIGVRLSLINNVSSGLIALAGQFGALHKNVLGAQGGISQLEGQLLNLKRLGLVGGAMAAAGGFGLSLLRGPLDEAKKFQLEVAKFEALGLGEHMNRDAVEFARGMKTYGTSLTENMVLFRDAQTVFRDAGTLDHAKMVTPLLARMRFANETLFGADRASTTERGLLNMLRVIEMRKGLNNPEEFQRQANMVQQVLTTSGGRVDAGQYLNLIKTGGVAAKALSNEALYYQLEPLIMEMGGLRVGTGLMSAYQNLVLGRTSVQSAKELNRLGLLDEKHVEYNKIGMIKRILPGGLRGGETMEHSPVDFLEKVLLPAFRSKGITSEEDTLREIGLIFSNRTASQLFSTMFQQLPAIRKGEKMSAQALTIDQADTKARETAVGKEIELHKKWKDVLNALGTTVLPIAIKAVEGLTTVLRWVGSFANTFPRLTSFIVIAFSVLSGIVAAGGVLALATAGFKALGLAMTVSGSAGGIGALLGGTATAMTRLGAAAGVFMAAYAGWLAGGFLNDSVINPLISKLAGRDETLGGALHGLLHRDPMKTDASPARDVVRGRSGAPVQVHTQVNMDGHKVASVVSKHQAKAATGPQGGTSWFDAGMAPPPVNFSY